MPSVSVIIPCYNEEKTILFLLKSLLEQTYPLEEMEVIIADGLSKDRTREVVWQFNLNHPGFLVTVVDNVKQNIPSALNVALSHARGGFIIRLDAHSVPAKDYIEKCVQDLQAGKGENIGGVWDIRPSSEHWMAKCISMAASHKLGVGDAHYRYTSQAGEVDTVPFGAFKKELFERIGRFDESLLTNEDYEFNVRIRKSGGKIWLNPSIRSVYFSRPDLSSLATQYWRYGLWKWRMLRNNPSTLKWRQALPPAFLLSLLFLLGVSIFLPWALCLLLIELILYLTVIFAGTFLEGLRNKDIRVGPGIGLAIITMHFAWGAGFLWSMVKSIFGR